MAKDIKTREFKERKIKQLDKPIIYSQRMKDKLINNKDIEVRDNEFEENEVQYATNRVSYSASSATAGGANEIKKDVRLVHNKIRKIRYKDNLVKNSNFTKRKQRAISNNFKKIKTNPVKTKSLKTIENSKKTVKATAETAKKTVHIAKNVIAKAKVVIEKAVQIAISLGKKAILLLKSLGALIVAGGTVSVVIIVLICLIGFLLASPFGLFFADETPINNETLTLESAKTSLTTEVDEKINQIKDEVEHDSFSMETNEIAWKEILTYYAVVSSNREVTSSVMSMNSEEYDRLKEVFWNAVNVDYDTEKYTKTVSSTDKDGNVTTKKVSRTRLKVYVTTKSADEMKAEYNFSDSELKQINEMLSENYNDMWEVVLPTNE